MFGFATGVVVKETDDVTGSALAARQPRYLQIGGPVLLSAGLVMWVVGGVYTSLWSRQLAESGRARGLLIEYGELPGRRRGPRSAVIIDWQTAQRRPGHR